MAVTFGTNMSIKKFWPQSFDKMRRTNKKPHLCLVSATRWGETETNISTGLDPTPVNAFYLMTVSIIKAADKKRSPLVEVIHMHTAELHTATTKFHYHPQTKNYSTPKQVDCLT